MNITSITFILQLLHVLQSIYICITHFTSVVKNDLFVMCGQATFSMSTRMFEEGYPPGLLLVFYQLWEQIQGGMTVGAIQSQWGALSWWWNAMICCLKDGISKQPQYTLKDGLTNQKLRHTLFEQVISMISQKVTKCWVTLGTVTIAFVQPVTGWIQLEFISY